MNALTRCCRGSGHWRSPIGCTINPPEADAAGRRGGIGTLVVAGDAAESQADLEGWYARAETGPAISYPKNEPHETVGSEQGDYRTRKMGRPRTS